MLAVSCKLQILASEIYQTKFTGSVSRVVFFKTVSFSVQVKLAHCPCLPLAFIWNNRRAHQPWPFTLERVPPGISVVHYMQSSKSCSHSGEAWTLARNARIFPDFRCVHSLRTMAVLSRALLSSEVAKVRAKSARKPISSQFQCPYLGLFARLTEAAMLRRLMRTKTLGSFHSTKCTLWIFGNFQ